MKYIKTYESFKNQRYNKVDEGFFDLLKNATGAFKNFLTSMATPWKNLKEDIKKGMKFTEVKDRIIKAVDEILKTSTENIKKATDEAGIIQMTSGFDTQMEELSKTYEDEIKKIKESKVTVLNEGKLQNVLIGAKVMIDILKSKTAEIKKEYDEKFAKATDLEAKKNVAITKIKTIVEDFKKKISDEALIKQKTEDYKEQNNIVSKLSDDILKSYNVTKVDELKDKEIRYKREDYDDSKEPDQQEDNIGTGKVTKIENENVFIFNSKINKELKKSFDDIIIAKGGSDGESDGDVGKKINDIKSKSPEKAQTITKLVDYIENADGDKMKKIDDILSNS